MRKAIANAGAIDSESRQSQGLVYTAEQCEYGAQHLQPHCLVQLFLPPTNLEILGEALHLRKTLCTSSVKALGICSRQGHYKAYTQIPLCGGTWTTNTHY